MSKTEDKAEQRALEAYPILMCYNDYQMVEEDINKPLREIYQEGYHQAEKDLTDISWIKEVSGVKDMSRAEEEALKAYPPRSIAANYDTINRRNAFEYGYLKAEQDKALTWRDMECIIKHYQDIMAEKSRVFVRVEYYQEVLKRFLKERKEK